MTGGIGYKRDKSPVMGTPGYDNGAAKEFAGTAIKADGTANADYADSTGYHQRDYVSTGNGTYRSGLNFTTVRSHRVSGLTVGAGN